MLRATCELLRVNVPGVVAPLLLAVAAGVFADPAAAQMDYCGPQPWPFQNYTNYEMLCERRWGPGSECDRAHGWMSTQCQGGWQWCLDSWALFCGRDPDTSENGSSPIMINLGPARSQRDFDLTCAEDGLEFDVNADGSAEQTAWPSETSTAAFLVQLDGAGQVPSGRYLFGNQSGFSNGYEMLEGLGFDTNADGILSPTDGLAPAQLLWWTDGHGGDWDGKAQAGELRPFFSVVTRLWLRNRETGYTDSCGNEARWVSRAQLVNGRMVRTADWIFRSLP
jgi:hypothetical protein